MVGVRGRTAEKPVGTVWIGVPRRVRKKVSSGRNGERDVAGAALLATTRQCSTANQEPCITKDTFC